MSNTDRFEDELSFIDSRFGKLNDRFLPPEQQAPADEDWVDRRFSQAPAEVAGPFKSEIVRFANEDADARRLLAQAGVRDEADASIFRTRTCLGEWTGTMQFDAPNSRYIFTVQREDGEGRILFVDGTIDNRDAAIVEAGDQLNEADRTAHIHILNADQYLLVNRLAAANVQEAISAGLALLFGDHSDDLGFDPTEFITHAENQEALQQLMWCVFTGSPVCDRLGAEDLEKFKQYAVSYIGDRAWNLSLLKSALDDYKNQKVNQNLIALDRKLQQPEPEIDLDSLSDEQVDDLYDRVSATYIKATRKR